MRKLKIRYPEFVKTKPKKKKNYNYTPIENYICLYLDSRIPYGKHKGKIVEEVMEFDSNYWAWFSNNHRGGICYWEKAISLSQDF